MMILNTYLKHHLLEKGNEIKSCVTTTVRQIWYVIDSKPFIQAQISLDGLKV